MRGRAGGAASSPGPLLVPLPLLLNGAGGNLQPETLRSLLCRRQLRRRVLLLFEPLRPLILRHVREPDLQLLVALPPPSQTLIVANALATLAVQPEAELLLGLRRGPDVAAVDRVLALRAVRPNVRIRGRRRRVFRNRTSSAS